MGAIFGFIQQSNSPLNQQHLAEMSTALSHCGPSFEFLHYQKPGGIGLRALDQEPFFNQHQDLKRTSCVHAFDGYLWNLDEISHQLYGVSQTERTLPEILQDLYDRQGKTYSSQLFGPYSSALLDRDNNRLILSRNITGQRTVYYAQTDHYFAFASEMKGLLKLPDIDKGFDRESLSWYLAMGYIPQPRTIYPQIKQLPPGARLYYDLSSSELAIELPDLREGREPLEAPEPEDYYVDVLDQLLTKAIEAQLARNPGNIGCFLTGGIDTSLVASIIKKVTSRPVKTFVVGFGVETCDERPYAKRIADHLGTEHHSLLFSGKEFFDLTHRLIDLHDEPFSDLGSAAAFYGTSLARQHADFTFTGATSDFLFGNFDLSSLYNYYRYFPLPLRKFMMATGKWVFESDLFKTKFPNMPLLSYFGGRSFFETFFVKWSSSDIEQLLGIKIDIKNGNFQRTFDLLKGMPLAGRIQKSLYSTHSTECIDKQFERCSMFHSLHTINPYLSKGVYQFANELPDRLKFRKNYGKILNRRLLFEKYVPREICKSFKRGTSLPFCSLTDEPMNRLIDQYLHPERLQKEGIFSNLELIKNSVTQFRNGDQSFGQKLWTLIVFEIWLERMTHT
ncbi:MAG: hypothetical protein D6B25_11725 [Desulfobulbaceae bacterium]|nr:MAG: hypothetical protein D6B25_11725 [Desulfobulbaceae bacterium]